MKVAEMYLRGIYQVDIAKELDVTQATISNDLKAIRKEWRTSRLRNFDAIIEEQLAKIDLLEQTFWDAWNRSKDSAEKITNKEGMRAGEPYNEKSRTIEEQIGNPKFLQGVMDCIKRRCELLGLDKEQEDTEGGKETIFVFAAEAKPKPVAEERKTVEILPGKTLPPGTSLDQL